MTNTGRELHHQQLLTVPESMATEDLTAGLLSGEAGPPPPGVEAAGGVGAIGPGATGITTLNMTSGDYLLVCFIPNAKGVPHMALGMIKPITVIESSAPVAALPEAKVSIDMVDFGFGLSGAISAGPQNISVTNIRRGGTRSILDSAGAKMPPRWTLCVPLLLMLPLDRLPLKLWLVSSPLPQGVAVHSTSMLLLATMRSYVSWKTPTPERPTSHWAC